MNSKRVFFVMIGIVSLMAVATVGILVLGNSMLEKQASKLTDLKLEDQLLEEQQLSLAKAKSDVAEYAEIEDIAKTVVPQDKDQARAVREIIQLAAESGIEIESISFPSSNLGTRSTGTQRSNTPAVSQARPVDGIAGIYSLEMEIVPRASLQQPVTYYQFLDFLKKLENNRRTAQVTEIQIDPLTPDSNNPLVSFTLTINIFLKP